MTENKISGRVVALPRPPVRCSTTVRSTRAHTFDVFVRTVGTWWPAQTFSAGRDHVRDITIERQSGGRVFEVWDDGSVVVWGQVGVWEPPDRFVMSWLGTPVPTEVELSFLELGPSLTRVAVEHRGWEALTDEQLAEDCALPGGYTGGAYSAGWARILAALGQAVERGLG
jgi:hypothetical protein